VTTKKVLIIIFSVLAALVLLVVVFVGGILGFVFYQLGNSGASVAAKDFLSRNEVLQRDIGQVKDFGSIITGKINTDTSDGMASLSLKVVGEKKTVNATVDLAYKNGHQWRVTDASYVNDVGKTIELMDEFGPPSTKDTQQE
jgi:hypothetical protein